MEKTVEYKEIEFTCVFSIDEFVEEVLYGDDAHPCEGGTIYDLEIFIDDVNVGEILSEKQVDDIKDLIYDQL